MMNSAHRPFILAHLKYPSSRRRTNGCTMTLQCQSIATAFSLVFLTISLAAPSQSATASDGADWSYDLSTSPNNDELRVEISFYRRKDTQFTAAPETARFFS